MKTSTRPPDQYVVAPGSKYRLVANEYDRNVYGQCNYASYRTLMRCKQIRSKEELEKNGGRCEEHTAFSKVLERNHKKEVQRMHAENDTKMQRRRFDPWIASNEYISDEDDYLQAIGTLPNEIPELVNDNILDDHPLRYAGTYTDKDVLRIKMDLVQKDIDDLTEFKQLLLNQAQKEHEMMANDEEDEEPTDLPQRRVFKAAEKYSRSDYLTLTTRDPVYNQCCVGPNMNDMVVINHIVHSMLNKLDNLQPISVEKQCEKPALHLSKFCIQHVTLDRRQKLFSVCRTCGDTALGNEDPTCIFHLKSHSYTSSTCRCHRCTQPGDSSSNKTYSPANPTHEAYPEDDDDQSLANLSKLENMASPLQPLASPSSHYPPPPVRRYQGSSPAQLLRPPQMGPPPGNTKSTAAQRVVANMGGYHHQQQLQRERQRIEEQMKIQEEEMKSQTCARTRGADPIEYGEGKKKHQQQIRQQQQISPYKGAKMPSILPHGVNPGGVRPGGFAGWRNTAGTTGGTLRAMHQHIQMSGGGGGGTPTRFPVQQQRNPPRALSIPLERVQEPKTADELIEDRGDSPPTKYAMPEPQRRGVPYYKNPSVFRRNADQRHHVQPVQPPLTSSSGGHGGPPPPPQSGPQRFRPPANRPMAPHRAIAAGLNPADAVNPPTPRPSYRVVPAPVPSAAGAPQGPVIAMSPVPQVPLYHQPPVVSRRPVGQPRLVAGGQSKTLGSPPTVGIIGKSPGRSPSTTAGITGPSSSTSSNTPSSSNSLDSARHDARFANMNVKTFLSMSQKDLSTMTQEEIDLLSSSTNPKKSGTSSEHHSDRATKTPEGATKTPSAAAAAKLSKKRKIEETIDEVVQAVSQASTLTTPSGTSSAPPLKSPENVGMGLDQVGEPPAKKPSVNTSVVPRRRTTSEKEKETIKTEERLERARTPKKTPTPAASSVTTPVNQPPPPPQTVIPTSSSSLTPPISTTSTGNSGTPRAPRAAAIAANQAIVQRQPVSSSSTSSGGASSQEQIANPLDLLAELSEAAAAEEQQQNSAGTSTDKASRGKTPKKTSPKQRRSSAGSSKKRGESEEHEEQPQA